MFPPLIPSMIRAMNSHTNVGASPHNAMPIGIFGANPIIKKPADVPSRLTSSTGLRPTRSESFPRIGANTNCIAE